MHLKKEKKEKCQIMNLTVPENHRLKLKEKLDKYLDLVRELKNF